MIGKFIEKVGLAIIAATIGILLIADAWLFTVAAWGSTYQGATPADQPMLQIAWIICLGFGLAVLGTWVQQR